MTNLSGALSLVFIVAALMTSCTGDRPASETARAVVLVD